jgi:hypothetical protein
MQVSGGSAETAPVLGILTVISYVSGIDYCRYKGINEKFASLVKSRPNPRGVCRLDKEVLRGICIHAFAIQCEYAQTAEEKQ